MVKALKGIGKVGSAAANVTKKPLLNAGLDGAKKFDKAGLADLLKKAKTASKKGGDAGKDAADAGKKVADAGKAAAKKADDAAEAAKKAKKAKKLKRAAAMGIAGGVGLGYLNDRFASDANEEARAECERACQPLMQSATGTAAPFDLCDDMLVYPQLEDFVEREGVHREGEDDEGTPVSDFKPGDPKRVAVLENLKCVSCAEGHRPDDGVFEYEAYQGDAGALREHCTPVCAEKCLQAYPVDNVGPVEKAIAAVQDAIDEFWDALMGVWNFSFRDAAYIAGLVVATLYALSYGSKLIPGRLGVLPGGLCAVFTGLEFQRLFTDKAEAAGDAE